MRLTIHLLLFAFAVAVSGCRSKPHAYADVPPPSKGISNAKPIIKSADVLNGKVVSYNVIGRFVIFNFPVTQMPAADQPMFLYREGLKVGEVKITWQKRDDLVVADLVNGEAKAGDEVRDR